VCRGFLICGQSCHLDLVYAVTTWTQQMIMPLIRTIDPLKFLHFVDTVLHPWEGGAGAWVETWFIIVIHYVGIRRYKQIQSNKCF
jgi:hypothetical protein